MFTFQQLQQQQNAQLDEKTLEGEEGDDVLGITPMQPLMRAQYLRGLGPGNVSINQHTGRTMPPSLHVARMGNYYFSNFFITLKLHF